MRFIYKCSINNSIFTFFTVLLSCLIFITTTSPANAAPFGTNSEALELTSQIRSINLLNSLYLTKRQFQQLLPIVLEADRLNRELEFYNDSKKSQVNALLTQVRDQLKDNIDLSKDLKKKFRDTKKEMDKTHLAYEENIKKLTAKVKTVLNENQLVMISEYKPCIVPQKSVTNPERIGQSDNAEKLDKVMKKIRSTPQRKYKRVKSKILSKMDENLKKKIKDNKARQAYLDKVSKTMDKVRKMSDEDYEIKKQKIFETLAVPKKKYNPGKGKRKKSKEDKYISRFILNPNIIPYLEYKAK